MCFVSHLTFVHRYVFIKSELSKDLSQPLAAKLMLHQIANGVLRGRLPIAEEEAVYLALCMCLVA